MSVRIGINGFGRMGRLALRAAWDWPELAFTHVNELRGDASTAAHLLTFDSIHGRWSEEVHGDGTELTVNGTVLSYSNASEPGGVPWGDLGVEIVLECSGRFRTPELLDAYFHQGVRKVIVAAPVKELALNVVVGVNDDLYEPQRHHLLTAASCQMQSRAHSKCSYRADSRVRWHLQPGDGRRLPRRVVCGPRRGGENRHLPGTVCRAVRPRAAPSQRQGGGKDRERRSRGALRVRAQCRPISDGRLAP